MTQFPIHTIDSAPEDSRESLRAVKGKFGFVPNLLGELAEAPSALQAYLSLSGLFGATSLNPIEQQVVLITTSRTNGCDYCVAAHSAGLKMAGADDAMIRALRDGRPVSDPRIEALRKFTVAVVEKRAAGMDNNIDELLKAGFKPGHILEVLLGVAMKTLSNYANHVAQTPLDPPFQPFAWTP